MSGPEEEPLRCGGADWGYVRELPWDAESFGFPVATLRLREDAPPAADMSEARDRLAAWAGPRGAEVIGTSVAAHSLAWLAAVQRLGFVCVDLSLQVALMRTKGRSRALRSGSVRPAVQADHASIEEIAATSFDFGRYHRDVRFPRALADRRFGQWMRNSLREGRPEHRFYVMGPDGAPTAFMFVEARDGRVRLQLGGVSRSAGYGLQGPLFFAGVLDALEAEGARSVVASISAANTPVLNIYSSLGFHASRPEFTFHWHRPGSRHLLPPGGDSLGAPSVEGES